MPLAAVLLRLTILWYGGAGVEDTPSQVFSQRCVMAITQRYSSENHQVQQVNREQPLRRKSQEPKSPQWFLISEDHSLSLRLVSGAILCEGDDGELVVSAQDAAHAARFDIIEDELWLSCMSGRVRADGHLIAHHRRVESGVQLQIGITRYFVADAINEIMPEIPVLQNRLDASDTRLPKPGGRQFPVFYEGPLEIEEIIISEAVSLDEPRDDAAPAPTEPPHPSQLSANELRQSQQTAARSTGSARNRLLTAPAIIGLGAALAYAGYQIAGYQIATRDSVSHLVAGITLAGEEQVPEEADNAQRAGSTSSTIANGAANGADDSIQTEFAHLAWVDEITTTNHERILTLTKLLGLGLSEPENRAALERYTERLLAINDPDQLELLVLSFGGALSNQPQWRDLLGRLETRVIDLSKVAAAEKKPAETQLTNS